MKSIFAFWDGRKGSAINALREHKCYAFEYWKKQYSNAPSEWQKIFKGEGERP